MKDETLVWLVRWKRHSKNNCVFQTQNTSFRIFSTREKAEAFQNELRRRIRLRWEADTGLNPAEHWSGRTGSFRTLDEAGGYSVKDEWGVVSEICCEALDRDGLDPHDVKGVSDE